MTNSPEYLAARKIIEALPVKKLKNAILFLNEDKKAFAGVNKAGVWMSVSKRNGKTWYFYMSTIEEERLGLDKLRYSENCELAKEIVKTHLDS